MDRMRKTYLLSPKDTDKSPLFNSREVKEKSEKSAQASEGSNTSSTTPLRQEANSNAPTEVEPANSGSKWPKFLRPSRFKKYDRL